MKPFFLFFLLLWSILPPLAALEDNFDFGAFSQEDELTLATRAKWRIFSQKEAELQEGVRMLEPLLLTTEFKRLQPDHQAKIVLLLLEGYERTHQLQKGTDLLFQQLKRPELWKAHTIFKADVSRLLYLQEKYTEADAIFKPLCTANNPEYASFEKKKISKAILAREKKIHEHLDKARELLTLDQLSEAMGHLETVLPSLREEFAPFQGSPLKRKELAMNALFSLSECYSIHHPEQALFLLNTLEKEFSLLLSDERKNQIQALRSIAQGTCPNGPFQNKERALLWQAHYALCQLSQENQEALWQHEIPLPQAIEEDTQADSRIGMDRSERSRFELRETAHAGAWAMEHSSKIEMLANVQPILESVCVYMQGMKEMMLGHAKTALNLFASSLQESGRFEPFFQKQCLEAYQEALWMRAFLCFMAEKNDTLLPLVEEGLSHPRKSCFQALQSMLQRTPIELSIEPTHLVSLHLQSILNGESIPNESIAQLSSMDQLFLHLVSCYTKRTQCFEIQTVISDSASEPYINILNIPKEDSELEQLLQDPHLMDAHPKILHRLLKNALLKKGTKKTLEPLIQQFLAISSGYGKRREALFDYFLFIDTNPEFSFEDKKNILEEIVRPPCTLFSMLSVLYLQKHGTLKSYTFPNELQPFIHILNLMETARTLQKEAEKTLEMGQKTDLIRLSLQRFQEAEIAICSYLEAIQTKEERTVLIGVYIQLLSKWSELLFNEIRSDHPFLELEEHVSIASNVLGKAHHLLKKESGSLEITIAPRTLFEVQELKSALDLLTSTFTGEYEEALLRYRSLSQDSLLLSRPTIMSVLYLVQSLRKRDTGIQAWPIIASLHEKEIQETDRELALEVAIEKSLCLADQKKFSQAMAHLAWVINDSAASSLRIKAMVLRAELYQRLKRPELATRQLEAAKGKGGPWGEIAERKLKELYGTGDDTFSLHNDR